jgi:hypothetical protein
MTIKGASLNHGLASPGPWHQLLRDIPRLGEAWQDLVEGRRPE